MRRAALALALVSVAIAAPGTAHASRIVATGTAGPAAEVFPMYKAARGERNRVQITLGRKGITISDAGVRRIGRDRGRHPLCRPRGARRVFCKGQSFVD